MEYIQFINVIIGYICCRPLNINTLTPYITPTFPDKKPITDHIFSIQPAS
ncbi:hypothetical protein LU604_14020 [Erwinia tracheiphila]|nr:hypothetical protein [Erwinia tracheiphila]UIA81826.1 hypothetical protein LU604_14020 [Erwinia tracheiphila]UIA90421.1 hypothetical protein LU632_13585 [Erwinia tracheiphila]